VVFEQQSKVFDIVWILQILIFEYDLGLLVPDLVEFLLPLWFILSNQRLTLAPKDFADFVFELLLELSFISMINLVLNYVLEKLVLFEALVGENLLVKLLDVGIVVVFLVLAILVELGSQVVIIGLIAVFKRLQKFTLKLMVHTDSTQLEKVYFLD
jgi:hypothetical protein